MAALGRRESESSRKGSKFETRRPVRIICRGKVCACELTFPPKSQIDFLAFTFGEIFQKLPWKISENTGLSLRAQGFSALVPEGPSGDDLDVLARVTVVAGHGSNTRGKKYV